jgi:predicted short-subunit dehydrogenase-like oxidoreductase (DUF2520 family)
MPSPKKSQVVAIVGGGRVGRALGRLLHRRGWRIGAVVARSAATARAATRAIGAGQPHVLGASPRRAAASGGQNKGLSFRAQRGISLRFGARDQATVQAVLAADIVLITTPDAAIAAVANQLAQIKKEEKRSGNRWRGKIVLHTCGALDRSVLRPLERRGAATGSLHPLQTFGKSSLPKLNGIACAIEGSPAALRAAQRICRELGCIPIRIPVGGKPAYHAAAAMAAGHVLGLVEAATRTFMAAGFSRQQAVRALLPLTRQTLANFERHGALVAWTGPAARGDLATIRKHEAALHRFPREYRAAYAALTRLSILLLARTQ